MKIGILFNLTEGELELIKSHNKKNLLEILYSFFDQICDTDFEHLSEEDIAMLRYYGYKTEEEIVAETDFKLIPFTAYITYIMMRKRNNHSVWRRYCWMPLISTRSVRGLRWKRKKQRKI